MLRDRAATQARSMSWKGSHEIQQGQSPVLRKGETLAVAQAGHCLAGRAANWAWVSSVSGQGDGKQHSRLYEQEHGQQTEGRDHTALLKSHQTLPEILHAVLQPALDVRRTLINWNEFRWTTWPREVVQHHSFQCPKALNNLDWPHSWPSSEQEDALESFRGPFQMDLSCDPISLGIKEGKHRRGCEMMVEAGVIKI